MISAISPFSGSSNYWSSLLPTNQFAFTRLFDTGQYLRTLFASEFASPDQFSPAFFVELKALEVLQDSITPLQTDAGAITDGITRLLIARFWPSDAQQSSQSAASVSPTSGESLVGQLFNQIA